MSSHIEALRDIALSHGFGVCDEVADELEEREEAMRVLVSENERLRSSLFQLGMRHSRTICLVSAEIS